MTHGTRIATFDSSGPWCRSSPPSRACARPSPISGRATARAPCRWNPRSSRRGTAPKSRIARPARQPWLAANGPRYAHLKLICLGDDLASRQPTCDAVGAVGAHFLFTAKPPSHKTPYAWLDGADVPTFERKHNARPPTEENRARLDLVLQARPAPHPDLPAEPVRFARTLVSMGKLMDVSS